MRSDFIKLIGVIGLVSLFFGTAVAQSDEVAFKGEYIISAKPIFQERVLEQLNDISPKAIDISSADSNVILVENLSSDTDKPGDEELVDPELSTLCDRLKRYYRNATREGEFVRKFDCEENTRISTLKNANDPYMQMTWGMSQSNNIDINAPEAWDLTTGDQNIIVGIIDTGIDYNHQDLSSNIWTNPGETPGDGIDNDQNGYVDDVHGYDFVNDDGDPMDDQGHGTHVAGTIGGVGDNSKGVAGVSWKVKMVGMKFLSSTGSGSLYDAIRAIDYGVTLKKKGVNIVLTNNSWGGGGYSQALKDAINRSRIEGQLFVAAAGNSSQNMDLTPGYPASYDLDNVVSVAALDSAGNIAYFSNYGATNVDIAAPGVNIASTYLGNQYKYLSGTSMACPHVAGGLALLKAYAPHLSYGQLRDTLFQYYKSVPAMQGKMRFAGMMDVYQMLINAPAPPPPVQPTPTPTPVATPTPMPTPDPNKPPVYYSIVGTVSINGKGVEGATVTLSLGNGKNLNKASGPNGVFVFGDILEALSYRIDASSPGALITGASGILRSDAYHDLIGTSVNSTVSLIVVSPSGLPISGVSVVASIGGETKFSYSDSSGYVNFQAGINQKYTLTPVSSALYNFGGASATGVVEGNVVRVIKGRRE